MKEPVLIVMAAGMGSRYGGLKQIDPVDAQGHIIMDFSIYDAKRAGFEEVVFIIKKENEEDLVNSYIEFVGDSIEEIENLLAIIGKHVYNKEDGEYVKLIIE